MADPLVGKKVRLTGSGWGATSLPAPGAVLTLKERIGTGWLVEESGACVFLRGASLFGAVIIDKRPVYVVAWANEFSGGFDWSINRRWAVTRYNEYILGASDDESVVLAELQIDVGDMSVEARDMVTEFIDGELQDAIASGLVGKVVAHSRPKVGTVNE
jgi:hypothetical protein